MVLDSITSPQPPTPEELARYSVPLKALQARVAQVVVGQDTMIRGLMLGLLTNGHVLLEGVPGLAKTLTISTVARAIDASFKRVQFTPDLLPADLTGTQIYNPRDGTFTVRKGPIFANLVLADEINRAPAKVQSALLEAMQERHVTIGEETFALPEPFLVLATQNPIEQEGTYPLPEAQVDRFMLKLRVGYPDRSQERQILDRMAYSRPSTHVQHAVTLRDIAAARELADRVHIDEKVREYIVDIVHATRDPAAAGVRLLNTPATNRKGPSDAERDADRRLISFGASPRATICLALASKASALLEGRGYVTPHDVKTVAMDVLRHRVIVSYEAEAQEITPETIIRRILDTLPVP